MVKEISNKKDCNKILFEGNNLFQLHQLFNYHFCLYFILDEVF